MTEADAARRHANHLGLSGHDDAAHGCRGTQATAPPTFIAVTAVSTLLGPTLA